MSVVLILAESLQASRKKDRHDEESKITDDFKKKYKMQIKDIDPKTGKLKKTGKMSHRKYGHVSDEIEISDEFSNLTNMLWKETGEDKEITLNLMNNNITENVFLQNLMEKNNNQY